MILALSLNSALAVTLYFMLRQAGVVDALTPASPWLPSASLAFLFLMKRAADVELEESPGILVIESIVWLFLYFGLVMLISRLLKENHQMSRQQVVLAVVVVSILTLLQAFT